MFRGAFIKIPVDTHAKAKQSGMAISKEEFFIAKKRHA
jgi:hypothetical protein